MMYQILILICALVILQDLLVLILFRPDSPVLPFRENYPRASILLAVRDEEENIQDCLDALLAQDYPEERLEIVVGDDGSEDRTAEIALKYVRVHSNVRYEKVPAGYAGLRGKARPLAWLARRAEGNYFLVTDADTRPDSTWARSLVGVMHEGDYDLVNGNTRVAKSVFQDMEWTHAQGLLRTLGLIWRPVTGIGNNMGFTREAYEAVGGYEKIPFSLTEDRALYVAAMRKGFRLYQSFGPASLAVTKPIPFPFVYLRQRKRWMTGAVQLPAGVQVLLGLQSLYILFCLGLAVIDPLAGGVAVGLRVMIRLPLWYRLYRGQRRRPPILHTLWFELASGCMNLILLVYFLWPGGVEWKGRKYRSRFVHP